MTTTTVTLIVIAVIIVILAIILISSYNSLVGLKNNVEEGWAQIDVQLKRRTDLIPNLMETVKGYASHERQVFENVTAARSNLMKAGSPAEKAKANNELEGTLKSLFAVAEAYPQLRATENFSQFQEELTTTENKISFARQYYNSNVRDFNNKIQAFPSNIIASMFKFTEREYFEVQNDAEKEAPKVSF
jgi:LemA protein